MTNTEKSHPGAQFIGEVTRIFVVRCNEDRTEGRGGIIDHSYHLTSRSAIIAANAIGPMGATDGEVEETLGLKLVDGSFTLLPKSIKITENTEAEAQILKRALGKLSPAELVVLRDHLKLEQ